MRDPDADRRDSDRNLRPHRPEGDDSGGEGAGDSFHLRPGRWQRALDRWIEERERDRPGKPGRYDRRLRPHLEVLRAPNSGPEDTVSCRLRNEGTGVATMCYVQFHFGPGNWFQPWSAYERFGEEIVTVQPGQERIVTVPWTAGPSLEGGRIVVRVFDPILDPSTSNQSDPNDRKITDANVDPI